jgi:hypothetical protein
VPKYQWFARRRYGFGVRPTTWQGWLITALAIGGVIGALVGVKETAGDILLVGVAGLYLAIAYSLGGTKKLVKTDERADEVDDNPAAALDATPAPVPQEIYGSQTPHDIAEAIVSRTGKFADASDDVASSDSVIVVKGLTKQFGQRVAF